MTDVTLEAEARRTVETVWRLESARILGGLTRLVRDVGLAEELAQDALVAALEDWPRTGVPNNPAGWLMLTAKHRAIDRLRRNNRLADKVAGLGHALADHQRSAIRDGRLPSRPATPKPGGPRRLTGNGSRLFTRRWRTWLLRRWYGSTTPWRCR